MFLDKVHRPERVLNIHFYMPPKQNAVDVMSCGKTDRDVIDFVMATLPQFGLYPFEARRESTGFIFNRVWAAVKRESLEVVAEGVSTPQEVDRMFEVNTGSAAGPFRMMDQVGLDVVWTSKSTIAPSTRSTPRGRAGCCAHTSSKADWGSSPVRASTTTTHARHNRRRGCREFLMLARIQHDRGDYRKRRRAVADQRPTPRSDTATDDGCAAT